MSMLEPIISNTFPERKQSALILVIINEEPGYKISQIVDFKINHQWTLVQDNLVIV